MHDSSPAFAPLAAPRALVLLLLAALLALAHIDAHAQARIKVLWYRYAQPTSHYVSFAYWLAANAHRYELSSGVAWDLSFFGPNDPAPDFARYNVLVIQSGEAFRTGPNRNADVERAQPDYRGILNNKAAIQAARGKRTFISATDGDYHALRGDPGKASPRADRWDGARGHLVNAVNWAGSGEGLGVVVWCDCEFPGAAWWQHRDSFLRDELGGHVKYFRDGAPVIAPQAAQFYLNHGLTNAGLAGWRVSFHGGFRLPVPGYTPLIVSSAEPGYAVAIASSTSAAAPAGPRPTLQFMLNRVQVHENDAQVKLSVVRGANARGAVSVEYATQDGDARAASDYRAASGTLTFDDGETGAKEIAIDILADRIAESAEHFTLALRNPANGAVLGPQGQLRIAIEDAGGEAQQHSAAPASASAPRANTNGGCSLGAAHAFDPVLMLLALVALARLRSKA
jgi:hypothetical protein